MIKLGLVRLNLGKVPIIEVARVFQICEAEDNNAASLVANGEVLTRVVKIHGGQDVRIRDICLVTLTKAIDVDPLGCLIRAGLWAVGIMCAALWFPHRHAWNGCNLLNLMRMLLLVIRSSH